MTFNFLDALLLGSIRLSQNDDQGATLNDILKYADYINHALPTYPEFNSGTKKLKSLGLIVENSKRLRTTKKFEDWWIKRYGEKKRFGLLKAMDEIKKYLDNEYASVDGYWENTTTELQETDFNESIDEYVKLTNNLIEKITKKRRKAP